MIETTTAPVKKTLIIDAPVERAFGVFTEGIATWWPLATHSIFGDDAAECFVEPHVGGRLYERSRNGEEGDWGTVLVWEPPNRIVLSWQPNKDRPAPTELEVRFTPDGDRTIFELEHRGWERLGAEGAESRTSYDEGWEETLGAFAKAASA